MTLSRPEQLALLAVIVFATAGLYYWTPEPFLYVAGLAWGLFLAEIARRLEPKP